MLLIFFESGRICWIPEVSIRERTCPTSIGIHMGRVLDQVFESLEYQLLYRPLIWLGAKPSTNQNLKKKVAVFARTLRADHQDFFKDAQREENIFFPLNPLFLSSLSIRYGCGNMEEEEGWQSEKSGLWQDHKKGIAPPCPLFFGHTQLQDSMPNLDKTDHNSNINLN